jgi:hypothetical protein
MLPQTLLVEADTAATSVTVGNAAPTIDDVSLNGGSNITLNEDDGAGNGFKFATTTIMITDTNGCDTIASVSAKAYRDATTTAGTVCTPDDNNCYNPNFACAATTTGGGTCTGGADTTVTYECGFKLWYIADPTNTEAFAGDIWAVAATTSDTSFATTTATNNGEIVEVLQLLAHNVTATIPYGSVGAGADTGAVNSTTTVTNSGNASLDTDIGCETMCTDFPTCSGGTPITFGNQEASTSPFTWGTGGTDCTATTSPTTYVTALAKPTATTSAVTDDISWGIGVPGGSAAGSYTGEDTFDAVSG